MTEEEIFNHLFEVAKTSKDKEGVVAACLVRDGEILAALPSSDDSKYHAEPEVIKKALSEGVVVKDDDILYSTVEPCGKRTNMIDCSSYLIEKGIKNVCYAAIDPLQHEIAKGKLRKAGIYVRQTENKQITEEARDIFNSTMLNPKKYKI
ncbi:MAG: hypothetical protein A3A43_03315 [Candidatus Liptonbacteria bacterium RIFCSPLOWO2_01_FULL_56_20]|uniref:CMP/dCMP-type deaminase domain-containing protein n=1 Tax=Candidatus Liptonbacteria bacterium RIFCSPLOWO2_01_FULL_56_20 TaxID=1798652 RepID=A0A1G2CKC4_9BACT|nr:MAG: hypothetical protein A3A43_03315 [Candidatus Liptonbacteria bacterium RIFCSPLOWO2_01_FULL_56_20]